MREIIFEKPTLHYMLNHLDTDLYERLSEIQDRRDWVYFLHDIPGILTQSR